MKLFEISNYLDTRVPLALQEEYDNCGLLIGDKQIEISSVLICLDCTEQVLEEAVKKKHNLIISHHPLLFRSIKRITESNYVEKIIKKAIKHDIAIYAMHTNLDNIYGGVSFEISKKISLKNISILRPKNNVLSKLVTYCPSESTEKIKDTLFNNGAGKVGLNYDECSFTSRGIGSFRPLSSANPFSGQIGLRSSEDEDRIEMIFPTYLREQVISSLEECHPYEEVAYQSFEIQNSNQSIGLGVIGEMENTMKLKDFLAYVKKKMKCNVIKYTPNNKIKEIKRVAICGGSGSFLLQDSIIRKADVYISSDFKYHDFFDSDGKIIIFDIGHYESEYFTQDLILRILKEKFSKLAIRLTSVCTNPILYY